MSKGIRKDASASFLRQRWLRGYTTLGYMDMIAQHGNPYAMGFSYVV